MLKKGTKIYSILKGKCPQCHEGDFFYYGLTYHPNKITKTHKHCSNCNLKYMLEPSFYFGAMYVNYGITVGMSIIIFLITNFLLKVDLITSFFIILGCLIVFIPYNLRLSRLLWINMFVSYKPKKD